MRTDIGEDNSYVNTSHSPEFDELDDLLDQADKSSLASSIESDSSRSAGEIAGSIKDMITIRNEKTQGETTGKKRVENITYYSTLVYLFTPIYPKLFSILPAITFSTYTQLSKDLNYVQHLTMICEMVENCCNALIPRTTSRDIQSDCSLGHLFLCDPDRNLHSHP